VDDLIFAKGSPTLAEDYNVIQRTLAEGCNLNLVNIKISSNDKQLMRNEKTRGICMMHRSPAIHQMLQKGCL